MSLVSRLTKVNDRMQGLADKFGIPQFGNVVMVVNDTQTLLSPRPKVIAPDSGRHTVTRGDTIGYLSPDVEINRDDRWLEGVSRNYPIELLEHAKYILNAVLSPGGIWVGTNVQTKFIDRNRLLDYKILVEVYRKK